jgi:uncharacterized membrane protein
MSWLRMISKSRMKALYIVVLLLWTIMFQIMGKIVAGDYPVNRDRVSEYKKMSVALCIGLIIAAIIAVFYRGSVWLPYYLS